MQHGPVAYYTLSLVNRVVCSHGSSNINSNSDIDHHQQNAGRARSDLLQHGLLPRLPACLLLQRRLRQFTPD